jgi:hypothetical protein
VKKGLREILEAEGVNLEEVARLALATSGVDDKQHVSSASLADFGSLRTNGTGAKLLHASIHSQGGIARSRIEVEEAFGTRVAAQNAKAVRSSSSRLHPLVRRYWIKLL